MIIAKEKKHKVSPRETASTKVAAWRADDLAYRDAIGQVVSKFPSGAVVKAKTTDHRVMVKRRALPHGTESPCPKRKWREPTTAQRGDGESRWPRRRSE